MPNVVTEFKRSPDVESKLIVWTKIVQVLQLKTKSIFWISVLKVLFAKTRKITVLMKDCFLFLCTNGILLHFLNEFVALRAYFPPSTLSSHHGALWHSRAVPLHTPPDFKIPTFISLPPASTATAPAAPGGALLAPATVLRPWRPQARLWKWCSSNNYEHTWCQDA